MIFYAEIKNPSFYFKEGLFFIQYPAPAERQFRPIRIFRSSSAGARTLKAGIQFVRLPTENRPPPTPQSHYKVLAINARGFAFFDCRS